MRTRTKIILCSVGGVFAIGAIASATGSKSSPTASSSPTSTSTAAPTAAPAVAQPAVATAASTPRAAACPSGFHNPNPADSYSGCAANPTPTPAPPVETVSQSNAVRSAASYLDMTAFSRAGLIHQLSSSAGEGYSLADATYGTDAQHADWNAQAARSAKSYLAMTTFSYAGMVQQLSSSAGEGFTRAQAEFGAHAAGL
ncbi:MAG: hypothetical protein JWR37_2526 [Mycobacterium sp.]|nr:hypothetical protein [Mycobacterium sp.]